MLLLYRSVALSISLFLFALFARFFCSCVFFFLVLEASFLCLDECRRSERGGQAGWRTGMSCFFFLCFPVFFWEISVRHIISYIVAVAFLHCVRSVPDWLNDYLLVVVAFDSEVWP